MPFLHRCLDAGLTHIDTGSAAGGFGRAQSYLGQVLRERRDEVFVATRCCEPEGAAALAELGRNLAELQIDQADLVYVQSIGDDRMTPERIFAPNGVCAALDRARRDGLTRWLGLSGHCRPARFVQALQAWDFDVMLTAVNIVARHTYPFESQVWPAAAAKGVGLLAMKVLGGVRDSATSAKGANLPDALMPVSVRHALHLPASAGIVVGLLDDDELRRALDWVRAATPLGECERRALDERTRDLARQWGEVYGPSV